MRPPATVHARSLTQLVSDAGGDDGRAVHAVDGSDVTVERGIVPNQATDDEVRRAIEAIESEGEGDTDEPDLVSV